MSEKEQLTKIANKVILPKIIKSLDSKQDQVNQDFQKGESLVSYVQLSDEYTDAFKEVCQVVKSYQNAINGSVKARSDVRKSIYLSLFKSVCNSLAQILSDVIKPELYRWNLLDYSFGDDLKMHFRMGTNENDINKSLRKIQVLLQQKNIASSFDEDGRLLIDNPFDSVDLSIAGIDGDLTMVFGADDDLRELALYTYTQEQLKLISTVINVMMPFTNN